MSHKITDKEVSKKDSDTAWHAITVTIPKESSDWISHLLFELGSVGNLEENAPDPALIAMKGYFPVEFGSSAALIQQISELLEQKGIKPLSTYSATIKIQNWAEMAQQMFSPIKILEHVTIVSPWSKYSAADGEIAIVINPGMAFGTGYHATTQLAARLISQTIDERNVEKMCDVGTGSAILSIIAAKKGVKEISAVEIDADARQSAAENMRENSCNGSIRLVDNLDKVRGKFDLVAANILFSIILGMKGKLIGHVKKDGIIVISGITAEEDEKFVAAFADKRLQLVEKRELDGWMGYKIRKI